jgi:hypothetical protein
VSWSPLRPTLVVGGVGGVGGSALSVAIVALAPALLREHHRAGSRLAARRDGESQAPESA